MTPKSGSGSSAAFDADRLPEGAPEGLARAVIRGAGMAGIGFALSRLLTFATYLVLARLAAPHVFGEFAAGSVLLGIGSVFVESGMVAALIQRRDRVDEAINTAFATIIVSGFVLAAAGAAASPLVGLVFGSHRVATIALALSGLLAVGAFKAVPDAVMQRRFSFLRRVVVDPVGAAAFGTTAIVALAYGLGVWALVLGAYASEAAQGVVSWYLSRWAPNFRLISFAMWRELARYARFVLAAHIVDHLNLAANTVLLGRFVSQGALGQYRYATRFGTLPHELVVNVASYVLMPAFSRIALDDKRFEAALRRALRWVLALVLPLSMLFVPLGTPLVVVLLGETWRPAGSALMVLSGWSAAHAAGSVAAAALKGAGRPQILPVLDLFYGALAVTLMIAFLPLGLTGVATGAAVAAVIANSVALAAVARIAGASIRALAADLLRPMAAAAGMVALLLPLDRLILHADDHGTAVGLTLLAGEAIAGAACYVTALLVLSPQARRKSLSALGTLRRRARPRRHRGENTRTRL